MVYVKDRPFNDLPLLPPQSVDLESRGILKTCIGAHAALAELRQAGKRIPNQSVLINTIPLLEAQGSSEIENIVTTSDELFKYAAMGGGDRDVDPSTKEAYRYRTALQHGYREIQKRPVTAKMALELCSILRNKAVGLREGSGVRIANTVTREVIYTPPEGEAVLRQKLANWERFMNERGEVDPLVRMAVGHYQFEAIHPFDDGNGRTGRILNILLLLKERLLEIPVLYLSRYIVDLKSIYYERLRSVTESVNAGVGENGVREDWEKWICFMIAAIEDTARWTCAKIEAVAELMLHTKHYLRDRLPKIYSHELTDVLFEQPYCRIGNLVEAGIVKRQTASVYLKSLVDAGVLAEKTVGRDKLFIHPQFLRLLCSDDHVFDGY
ncbi:Fic family protein [Poriferisphaera sp. WC338]|uniref:Fic family protein n=1 Tax=Poriferisphaera sp. WC338 TaxID=3425129 RepID=UPI003D812C6A